ncbi:hypothetical protein ES703_20484 [subsurface metagenome]
MFEDLPRYEDLEITSLISRGYLLFCTGGSTHYEPPTGVVVCSKRSPAMNLRPLLHRSGKVTTALFTGQTGFFGWTAWIHTPWRLFGAFTRFFPKNYGLTSVGTGSARDGLN